MPDQDTLIEKKLDGTLTPEESQHFDHLLRVDPAFAQAYADQRAMVTLFQQHQKELLHQRLEDGYRVYRKKNRTRWYYGAAAVALVVMLMAGWWWRRGASDRLFTAYYQPYELVSPRGGSSATENQATRYYRRGQYAAALPLLDELQQTEDNREYWTLLRGTAYLQLDSTARARAQFNQVVASSHRVYQQYGRWYTAMSYLKDKKIGEAQAALQPIANQPGLFQREARQLLNDL